ncbi:MAG: DUF1565 domain-containing protein [Verrucomicrobia bacterium]|nr:DUF1565 domain-containing protein [Verrucomicrobiota bacterium]
MMKQILPLLLLCILQHSSAAVLYVAKDGNDFGTGTQASPLRTVQNAVDRAKAGDVIYVSPGTYSEIVKTKSSGTSAAPIVITSLVDAELSTVAGFLVSHADICIDNLILNGQGVTGYQGTVTAGAGAHRLKLSRLTFDSSPQNVHQVLVYSKDPVIGVKVLSSVFRDANYHALSLTGSGHLVESNLFTGQRGWDAIRLLSSFTTISRNVFTNWSNLTGNSNHPDLIQAFSNNGEVACSNLISANLFVNCVKTQIGNLEAQGNQGVFGWQWRNNIWSGVEAAMSICAPSMHFYNNTFIRSGTNTGSLILFRALGTRGVATNCLMINNIFYQCGSTPQNGATGWYSVDASITDFIGDYNSVFGIGAGTSKTTFKNLGRELNGINGLDPRLITVGSGIFRLARNSPLIGRAKSCELIFNDDFSGAIRRGLWDIGAMQFQSGGVVPTDVREIAP